MGYPWYTDGKIEMQIKPGAPIPEGFRKGRKPESEETRRRKSENCWTRCASKEAMQRRNQAISSTKQNKSEEEKALYSARMSAARKGRFKGRPAWNKGKKSKYPPWNKGLHPGTNWNEGSAEKAFQTKLRNGTFRKIDTQAELEVLCILQKIFPEDDIKHPYRDERYPFNCDFYIVSEDLFIELNRYWTHGDRPYNTEVLDCQRKLQEWCQKAETSRFYKNAIETWTVRDVKKLNTARDNNLNYIAFYNESPTIIENTIRNWIDK